MQRQERTTNQPCFSLCAYLEGTPKRASSSKIQGKTTINPVQHTCKKNLASINLEGGNCVSGKKEQKQQSNAKGRKQQQINIALPCVHIWNTKKGPSDSKIQQQKQQSTLWGTHKKEACVNQSRRGNCVSGKKEQKQQSNAKGRKHQQINIALPCVHIWNTKKSQATAKYSNKNNNQPYGVHL